MALYGGVYGHMTEVVNLMTPWMERGLAAEEADRATTYRIVLREEGMRMAQITEQRTWQRLRRRLTPLPGFLQAAP